MINIYTKTKNAWTPPAALDDINNATGSIFTSINSEGDYFFIINVEPYVETLFVHVTQLDNVTASFTKRLIFHEDYVWPLEDEQFFNDRIVNNESMRIIGSVDGIYKKYATGHPEWNLKRYYTKPMWLLDHIYHCIKGGTEREMLYKAGLDYLAAYSNDIDELNLLANKPSDIYGLSMRVLRHLNCREGARLLGKAEYREFVKVLNAKFPDTFKDDLNDAQCQYLRFLIDGDLTVNEVGRLFNVRKKYLMSVWNNSQYQMFIYSEQVDRQSQKEIEDIARIDPIYGRLLKKKDYKHVIKYDEIVRKLRYYLLEQREEMDVSFRRSVRMRDPEWQERNNGYVVRYPQTINDFCREAVYMGNCLMAYVDAYLLGDTTILFMRDKYDYNTPLITIEIFENRLQQAYHRFNQDCTAEEAKWIIDYCDRHSIDRGDFKFKAAVDLNR